MNKRKSDIKTITRRKCQTKGCPNKATGIFKKKFLCKECKMRIHPSHRERNPRYVNYLRHMR